jgi:hypothetical protein
MERPPGISKRRKRVVLVLGLALVGGGLIRLQAEPSDRVLTVAQVQRGLATQPRRWINRTVRVRGVFRYSMSDAGTIDIFHPPPYILVSYALYQPGPPGMGGISGTPLLLKLAPHMAAPPTNPLAALVRQVPWLKGLLGGSNSNAPIFRITLLPPSQSPCPGQGCPAAQLDEQPW